VYMDESKFYILYTDKQQSKLLTTANTKEKLESETLYYGNGVWFEYDNTENSNLIINEKILKGVVFPEEPKKREYKEYDKQPDVKNLKWLT
jgi:hypothetical protein